MVRRARMETTIFPVFEGRERGQRHYAVYLEILPRADRADPNAHPSQEATLRSVENDIVDSELSVDGIGVICDLVRPEPSTVKAPTSSPSP
jgi:hypothetical protein